MSEDSKDDTEVPNLLAYEDLHELARIGVESRKLGPIIAYFAGDTLAEFVLQNVIAAAVAKRFPRSYMLGTFRNNPPYRAFIVECNSYVTGSMAADADSGMTLPVDWFDVGAYAPIKCPDEMWYDKGFHEPGLILLPNMLSVSAARLTGLAEAPASFCLPSAYETELREALSRRGLDPDRWFACLAVEGTAPGAKGDPSTTVDVAAYVPMLRHIVESLGGQVVRVGSPDAQPLPEMDGLINLSRDANSFGEQVAAASLARFVVGADSGILPLACAFRVPTAATNVSGFEGLVWNREDVVLAKKLRLSDGTTLATGEAFEQHHLDVPMPDGAAWIDNTPDELVAVAEHMFQATGDCSGWRPKAEDIPSQDGGTITFPLTFRDRPLVRFWD
jgi:putative glycosyltransferase (TIGR04372 family)